MRFSIKDFFSECDQIRSFCGLVTFTEKILNGELNFYVVPAACKTFRSTNLQYSYHQNKIERLLQDSKEC